ncbi:hypothetical protein TGME49_278005 [Toxoplasma gondii ME49]|uniref:Uncharacterized protein n=1 Tax=Toxoplasma gondii (strain ATCC 50611 / Me49) TaxID=508771 RepID=S8EPX8_TOXGM|nr:hypothetical protein TGME49_278005 [Toxoplasma gondii ME49]EPT25361.1 hypothetical protein TGME49_278005 [Toxoplasma gondii ME49]|eukprot:XP_018635149.1 hypothetical protein TGME49_278005 [Toxoplasma gondii ME49]
MCKHFFQIKVRQHTVKFTRKVCRVRIRRLGSLDKSNHRRLISASVLISKPLQFFARAALREEFFRFSPSTPFVANNDSRLVRLSGS